MALITPSSMGSVERRPGLRTITVNTMAGIAGGGRGDLARNGMPKPRAALALEAEPRRARLERARPDSPSHCVDLRRQLKSTAPDILVGLRSTDTGARSSGESGLFAHLARDRMAERWWSSSLAANWAVLIRTAHLRWYRVHTLVSRRLARSAATTRLRPPVSRGGVGRSAGFELPVAAPARMQWSAVVRQLRH